MSTDRILVLVSGSRVRRYPLLSGMELKDEYVVDGVTWTVVAVLSDEHVPVIRTLSSQTR